MAHKVILKPSGIEFLAEANKAILDSALNNDITIEHSCKNGDCGVCAAVLLTGKVKTDEQEIIEFGQILTCKATPLSDVEIETQYYPQLSKISRKTTPLKVNSFKMLAEDVISLSLRTPPTVNFEYISGQYIDLTFNGVSRSYSIANAYKMGGNLELHVKRVDGGAMSAFLFDGLKENTLMRAYGPNGTFFVRESDAPIAFLVTGTGFAPAKAMIEKLLEDKTEREILLLWGGRYEESFYSELPRVWGEEFENFRFVPVLSRYKEGWCGETGYVQSVFLKIVNGISRYHVYACGSQSMIDSAKTLLTSEGLNKANFFSDAFVATTK